MPDLLSELKGLDPVESPLPVQRESLDALRDSVIESPRIGSHRWIAPLSAAAAGLIVVALVWHGLVGTQGVPAVPAASPSQTFSGNAWVQTASSPLSPRHGSVTVWADGSFFVIGGSDSAVCSANADCVADRYLSDGARYNPATDSWTKIADAPQPVFGFPISPRQRTAALGRSIYLLGLDALLRYDVDSNRWLKLAFPQGDVQIGFGASGGSLVAVATTAGNPDAVSYATFQPDQARWVNHRIDGLRGSTVSAAVVSDHLVLTGLAGSSPAGVWKIDTLDLTTGQFRHFNTPKIEAQHLDAEVVTTSQAEYAVWRGKEQTATFLNPRDGEWSSVSLPDSDGAFAGVSGGAATYWPVTVSGMVALRGHLFDAESRLWATAPAMLTGRDTPLVVSGSDLVLSCFGYDATTNAFGKDCYVLRPAEASLDRP